MASLPSSHQQLLLEHIDSWKLIAYPLDSSNIFQMPIVAKRINSLVAKESSASIINRLAIHRKSESVFTPRPDETNWNYVANFCISSNIGWLYRCKLLFVKNQNPAMTLFKNKDLFFKTYFIFYGSALSTSKSNNNAWILSVRLTKGTTEQLSIVPFLLLQKMFQGYIARTAQKCQWHTLYSRKTLNDVKRRPLYVKIFVSFESSCCIER